MRLREAGYDSRRRSSAVTRTSRESATIERGEPLVGCPGVLGEREHTVSNHVEARFEPLGNGIEVAAQFGTGLSEPVLELATEVFTRADKFLCDSLFHLREPLIDLGEPLIDLREARLHALGQPLQLNSPVLPPSYARAPSYHRLASLVPSCRSLAIGHAPQRIERMFLMSGSVVRNFFPTAKKRRR